MKWCLRPQTVVSGAVKWELLANENVELVGSSSVNLTVFKA